MEKLTKREREEIKKLERIEAEKQAQKNNFIKKIFIIFGLIIFAGLSVLGLTKLANSNSSSVLSATVSTLPAVSTNDIIYGNKNSKVVLIEYSDFQCPACAHAQTIVNPLLFVYKNNILFVYRFFPLKEIHKNAFVSAQAAYAAKNQGKFWEMHDLLFKNQDQWAEKENAKDIFISYAKKLNLDIEKFKNDLDSKEAKNFVDNQENGGVNAGVDRTPTFFINGKRIENIGSYEDFKQIVEQELR